MPGHVVAVCGSPLHGFSKQPQGSICLLEGLGVEGDAHCGATVQHLYLKRRNPKAPNRMQVHLLQSELFEQLAREGHPLEAGELGENITTAGIDLLSLPLGTRLHVGAHAIVELSGLRTPCKKIERFQAGLLCKMQGTGPRPPARAGVMAIVLCGGVLAAGDAIKVQLPDCNLPLTLI